MFEVDFRADQGNSVKRVVWSTDLHLDAASKKDIDLLFKIISSYEPNLYLIGGDVSNGTPSLNYLKQMAAQISCPICFVLGNHDFYYGSIYAIRDQAKALGYSYPHIKYLTTEGVIPLTASTGLIGHDGWCDATAGDFINSHVMLNDYYLIDELKKLNQDERKEMLKKLGAEATDFFMVHLNEAFKRFDRIILLTHVPPFQKACMYEGEVCDVNWAPHFVNFGTGVVLENIMRAHPNKSLLVLCGHTHTGVDLQVLPNLRVITGQAELGMPNLQGLILIN